MKKTIQHCLASFMFVFSIFSACSALNYEHLALVKRYSAKVDAYGVDYLLGKETPHFTEEDRDLRNLDLDGAEVKDLNLSFADMTGTKWRSGKLVRCKFIRTNLTEVDFGPEQAERTILKNCILVLVSLVDSIWKQALMTTCFMEGIDFSLVSNKQGLRIKQQGQMVPSITRLPKVLQDTILALMLGKQEEIQTPDAIQDFFNPDLPSPGKLCWDDSCAICADVFSADADTFALTQCGHVYCFSCLNQWLSFNAANPSCPTCKHPIGTDKRKKGWGYGQLIMLKDTSKELPERTDPREEPTR